MSIAQAMIVAACPALATLLLSALLLFSPAAAQSSPQADADAQARALFEEAWSSAARGSRDRFEELGPALQGYVLYPYWQYEDYRHRRSQVPPGEMAAFLDAHPDWAFTAGLRTAWLRTLGRNRQWQALAQYGAGSQNTEVRCYHARARLATGDTEGLEAEALALWTVGRSQPDACDPLFKWLIDQGGVTSEAAWERVRLAMLAGNARLTIYLARFLSAPDRTWLERWQRLDRDRYRRLDRALAWRDSERTRMIADAAQRRLTRLDPARAMALFPALADHFSWTDEVQGDLARETALWAAVGLEDGAVPFMQQVPVAARDEQLHEWWARAAMADNDWPQVLTAIDGLPPDAADDERWRYWKARALLETGEGDAGVALLDVLATRTTYHGFLAADALKLPYTICPLEPPVSESAVDSLAESEPFHRSLELHRSGLDNWAAAEWAIASSALPTEQLKVAAGLARREGWHDRVIYALGDSGELRFYDWRFPILHTESIMGAAGRHDLDPAWVLAIMRSESAMVETARSPAGALGLMQVTPATAKTLSRRHGIPYRASSQLLQGDVNIRFGTTYLRDLLDDHEQNPVLVSGAYNAGPNAVRRWLGNRSLDDAAQWIETLPYYETRDYIPRVLTFATLYDWRLQNPVRRLSGRMPGIESGTLNGDGFTEVVCRPEPPAVAAQGSFPGGF
ncbi:MAG: transglycosylase SLT domain-containing protein [Pseudomonadota bacterium]